MKTFLTMTAVVALGVAITTAVSLVWMGTPMALSPLSLDLPAEPDAAPPISQPGPAVAADAAAKPLAVAEEDHGQPARLPDPQRRRRPAQAHRLTRKLR
jgi:hypothetical protein